MSKSKPTVIPEGALLTVSVGEYSDYCVVGVFRALAQIDVDALRADFLNTKPAIDEWDIVRKFLPFIFRKGLLEPVDCYEVALGDDYLHDMDVIQCRYDLRENEG